MSRYSFSQIQCFQHCPLKYRYQYIDKIDVKENSLPLALWIAVHSTLEFLYNTIFSFSNKIPELAVLLWYFDEARSKEILSFIDDSDKWISDWYYKRGISYISSYYTKFYPFNQVDFVKPEMNVTIQLSKDITLQGKIDRVDIKGKAAEIIDYKTNQLRNNANNDLHREQIILYGLGLMQKYEWRLDSIVWRLIYLHFDNEEIWDIVGDDLDRVREKYLWYCQIIDTVKLQFAFFESDAFKPNKWIHCDSCKFREICVARKNV